MGIGGFWAQLLGIRFGIWDCLFDDLPFQGMYFWVLGWVRVFGYSAGFGSASFCVCRRVFKKEIFPTLFPFSVWGFCRESGEKWVLLEVMTIG